MALQNADFVQETSTTTGTGTYNLDGAVAGFRTFVAGVGDTNTCYYCAEDGTDWEVGVGTVTDAAPDTLARTTILASSNAGSAVDWAAGTRYIRCTFPAAAQAAKGLGGHKVYTTVGASTWSKPANLRAIIVECQGGGGGTAAAAGNNSTSQPGGGGGYCRKYIAAASLGATETVTVGSGGATGGVSAAGSSTFGAHCTACGGDGGGNTGTTVGVGASGGLATSGTINIRGQDGGYSRSIVMSGSVISGQTTIVGMIGGAGGKSFFGGGGQGVVRSLTSANTSDATPGKAYGSAAGAGQGSTLSTAAGAAGAQGVVIVWEFF